MSNRREPEKSSTELPLLASDLRVVLGRLSRRMREQASIGDLTRSQTAVLSRLEREGSATTSALARAEGVTPQSMGANVAALEAAGLIAGAPDDTDGRKTNLSLTDAAREQFATGRLAREDWLQRAIASELSAEQREQLALGIDVLRRLSQAP